MFSRTVRPFLLTDDEVKAAPDNMKSCLYDAKEALTIYNDVSPLDCIGCGACVTVCPKQLSMQPHGSSGTEQKYLIT